MIRRASQVTAVLVFASTPLLAQNPRGEAKATVAGKSVSIEYGRPSLNRRDMLARAEVGKPWRMGAEDPTTLKTDADLRFGSTTVPKGSYVLKAQKVAADSWELLVLPQNGDTPVAKVPLANGKLDQSVEMFTIELTGDKSNGEFQMKWGTTLLKAPFTGK